MKKDKDKLVSEIFGEEAVLTPSDLYSQEFGRVLFGGYRPQEVDTFLERVADIVEHLNQRVSELKKQQEEYRQMEDTLRSALVASHQLGENLVESARREAETLIGSAQAEKERIERGALNMPDALRAEIRRLREQRDRLRAEIRAVLASHQAMLDSHAPTEDLPEDARFFGFHAPREEGPAEPFAEEDTP